MEDLKIYNIRKQEKKSCPNKMPDQQALFHNLLGFDSQLLRIILRHSPKSRSNPILYARISFQMTMLDNWIPHIFKTSTEKI